MPYLGTYTGAPTVEPDAGAKAGYLKENATPEAFGVGVDQARQGLDKAIGQAAGVAGDWADKLQDQYNTAAATNIENSYNLATAERTAQHNQLTGAAAIADAQPYQQFLIDKKNEILGQSPNSAVSRLVAPHLDRISTGLTVSSFNHVAAQTKQYALNESQTRQQIYTDKAGAADVGTPEGDRQFQDSMFAAVGEARNQAKIAGYAPDDADTQMMVKKAGSAVWNNRWVSLTQNGKADLAMKEYDNHRGDVYDPDSRIHDAIYTGQTSQYVSRLSRGLAAGDVQTTRDRENYAMTVLQDRVGKVGAAGLVGGMSARESGMRPEAINPGDGSDGSDSLGIAQWNSTRADALKEFAKGQKTDWRDFKTQVAFVDKELQDNPELVAKLKAARTPQEAATIANKSYEGSADKPGTPEHTQREDAAARLAGADLTSSNPMSPTRITELVQTARATAEKQFPDDPKIADQAEAAVRTRFNLVKQDWKNAGDEATYNMRDKIYGPTDADPNARPPPREQLLQDPTFKANYDALGRLPNGAQLQDRINRDIQRNINAVADSPDRHQRYLDLKGIADSDPARLKDMDLSKEDLTRAQASELHSVQKKITTVSKGDPNLQAGKSFLDRTGFFRQIQMMPATDTKPNPEYDRFIGQFNDQLKQIQLTGKKPDESDYKRIAGMLVTNMSQSRENFSSADKVQSGGNMFYAQPIPTEHRAGIVTQLKARLNRTPTEGEVRNVYNNWMFNQARNNPVIP